MTRIRPSFLLALGIAAIVARSAVSHAREIRYGEDTPVTKAVTNVESFIKSHPKDAAGYCALGRIHGLAWAYGGVGVVMGGQKIPLFHPGGPDLLPTFSEFSTILVSRTGPDEPRRVGINLRQPPDRQERPITAEDAQQLAASIAAYRKALELDPHDALSELGLGWMLARQGDYARELPAEYWGDVKSTDAEKAAWAQAVRQLGDQEPKVRDSASNTLLTAMPRCILILRDVKSDDPEVQARLSAVLIGHFELQALEHYRKAFELRVQEDLKAEPASDVDSQVSARAGQQILAVLARHPEAARNGEQKSVQDVVDKLARKQKPIEW